MKKHFSLLAMLVCTLSIMLLASCKTKEESAIADLNDLCVKIETEGADYSAAEWEKITKEYEEIHNRLSECDFTDEQLREVGKVEGKLLKAFAEQGTRSLLREGKGFLDGLMDGLSD